MRVLLCLILLISPFASAAEKTSNSSNDDSPQLLSVEPLAVPEPDWGIAIGSRTATIAFTNAEDDNVTDFVPKMYFEGNYLFLRGETGGLRFWNEQSYNLSVLGRYRYFDIPELYQSDYQGTNIDMGLQFEYFLTPDMPLQIDVMSDTDGNSYSDLGVQYRLDVDDFDFEFTGRYRYKSGEFNNIYYGLAQDDIGSDFDIKVGGQVRYHVISNLYLLGEANITALGNKTYQSDIVDERFQAEYYLGFGFFKNKKEPGELTLPDNHYLRVGYGWATPSNIGEVISGGSEEDEYGNTMTSLFYGVPLAETLFGLPIEMYVTPGFGYHFNSEVQDPIAEYVLAIKAYYTITWPVRWRLGFAEGLSYVSEVTYIESNDDPESNNSQILNYLDFSLDINLGDITTLKDLDNLWLGYSIHHRSAIFESSSLFGRSKGGSNYNTLYLQWHF
jgi:outer membrane protein